MNRCVYIMCLVLAWSMVGCSDRVLTLEPSSDWLPRCHGGRLQVKDLPDPESIHRDYNEDWKINGCRVYRYVMLSAGKQIDYKVSHPYGDTPVGASASTRITFKYLDTSGQEYHFEWYKVGVYEGDFLRLANTPIEVLAYPYEFDGNDKRPTLLIVGIKGFKHHWTIFPE